MTTKESNPPQLVLAGSLSIDHILQYDGSLAAQLKSAPLESLSLSVLLSGAHHSEGGVAGNIAYSLALLGEKPILYGAIGEDQKAYLTKLTNLGVVTEYVHVSQLSTASFTVITDARGRQIGGFHPGAMTDSSSLTLERFKGQHVVVVVSAHDPEQMRRQLADATAQQLRLVFDVGQQIAALEAEVVVAGLTAAELLMVNEYELELLLQKTGMSKEKLLETVQTVVVTLGEAGCRIFRDQSEIVVKAVSATLVDPTGAGDAFRAGFFYGYVRNWPLMSCAQLGATVAAFAVESRGTQQHSFTRVELEDRHWQQYQQKINWE